MSKNKAIWDTIWRIIKFILTIGISHIDKRKDKNKTNDKA